ncbi:hypothetical protein FQN57_007328 [Myotisia sp. PD_48]|nr:hypothetical protein FQN57_007328 [Myotisia sp. PD_48]
MKSVAETRARWNILFQSKVQSLDGFKQALELGSEGDNPCKDGLRSVFWKAFLLHKDVDRSQWPVQLADSRVAYMSVRNHFMKYIDNPNDIPSTTDPLAEDEKSPWESLRRDEAIRAEIFQDVERCLQENSFFQDPANKAKMLDILFIFVKLNPDLGYRQGMHELLAPVLWVVSGDSIDPSTLRNESKATLTEDHGILMLQTLDSAYVEHDSFSLFCAIMQTAKVFYEHSETKNGTVNQEVSSIVARSHYIHQVILRELDPQLADHLFAIEILPQIFLTRWIRLLFGREFPFEDVLSMWDLMIAGGLKSLVVDLVCITMLLRIRWKLLDADYTSALSQLLRYPSPEPIQPMEFVLDAFYLEANMTRAGASHLVTKYSGKSISQKAQINTSLGTGIGQLPLQRSSSTTRNFSTRTSMNGSPSKFSAKPNQKRFDNLFQDVSDGLYRRAEGWGVAKVVRGAMVEARRNIQGMQSSSSTPAILSPDSSSSGSPSPPRVSLTTARELSLRVSDLENRNRTLASMLGDALNSLKAYGSKREEGPAEGNIDELVTRFREIQVCLEDPTSQLPNWKQKSTRPIHGPHEDSTTVLTPKTQNQIALDVGHDTTKENSRPTPITVTSKETLHSVRAGIPSIGIVKPMPIRPISSRTSLGESSFSWILGEEQTRPSFSHCATSPPEQQRETPSSLFTDSQSNERMTRKPGIGRDSLLLSNLQHAPQR